MQTYDTILIRDSRRILQKSKTAVAGVSRSIPNLELSELGTSTRIDYSHHPRGDFIVPRLRATTILAVRNPTGGGASGGDGQVTLGNIVMKSDAKKIRKLYDGKVITGFAGAAADAFALLERFEAKLRDHQGSVPRAATELAKDWRTDRMLRRLEAMLIVMDRDHLLLLSGTGDVIAPTDNAVAIGSGGAYALSAARALLQHPQLKPAEVVRAGLEIAGDLCIYTNRQIEVFDVPMG